MDGGSLLVRLIGQPRRSSSCVDIDVDNARAEVSSSFSAVHHYAKRRHVGYTPKHLVFEAP